MFLRSLFFIALAIVQSQCDSYHPEIHDGVDITIDTFKHYVYSSSKALVGEEDAKEEKDVLTGVGLIVGPKHVLAIRPDIHGNVVWTQKSAMFSTDNPDPNGVTLNKANNSLKNHPFLPILTITEFPMEGGLEAIAIAEPEETNCKIVGWNFNQGHMENPASVWNMVAKLMTGSLNTASGSAGTPFKMGQMLKYLQGRESTVTAAQLVQLEGVEFLPLDECKEKVHKFGIPSQFTEFSVCVQPPKATGHPGTCPVPQGTALICNEKLRGIYLGLIDISKCKRDYPLFFLDLTRATDWISDAMKDEDES